MMNQMNNPLMLMAQALRAGRNPRDILMSMAQSDPRARQVIEIMRGKSPDQLRQYAQNIAAERGTTLEDFARSMGIQIPSSR